MGCRAHRGELFKLGISVSRQTVQRYRGQKPMPGQSSQTWSTFLKTNAKDVIEKEGCFVLKNEEAAQSQNTSERHPVWDGSDGHRVFARREAYRARPLDSFSDSRSILQLSEPLVVYQTHYFSTSRQTSYFTFVMRKPVWIRIQQNRLQHEYCTLPKQNGRG